MNISKDDILVTTPSQSELLPRPNPRVLPYMIEIFKAMGNVACEEEYSVWIQDLYHQNKLSLVSNVTKLVHKTMFA